MGGGRTPARDEIAALRLGLDLGMTRTWRCSTMRSPPRRSPDPLAML